jgi:hypothetical protein
MNFGPRPPQLNPKQWWLARLAAGTLILSLIFGGRLVSQLKAAGSQPEVLVSGRPRLMLAHQAGAARGSALALRSGGGPPLYTR